MSSASEIATRNSPRDDWPTGASRRAVFLDRDGVLIEDHGYVHRVADVLLFAGVAPALRRLQDAGFLLFIVTNQSGIGRGLYRVEDMDRIHAYLIHKLAQSGVRFAKIYFAPEAPDQPSRGRKPSPQFLFDAREEFGVDLSQSFMVGDKVTDLECGWNAGVRRCLLVRTGQGTTMEPTLAERAAQTTVVNDLAAAADWILTQAVPASGNRSR